MNKMLPNPMNTDFQVRSYGKSELALMYLPDVTPDAARRTLRSWIHRSPGLAERLREAGHTPASHYFTPRQVQLIVEALGEP